MTRVDGFSTTGFELHTYYLLILLSPATWHTPVLFLLPIFIHARASRHGKHEQIPLRFNPDILATL